MQQGSNSNSLSLALLPPIFSSVCLHLLPSYHLGNQVSIAWTEPFRGLASASSFPQFFFTFSLQGELLVLPIHTVSHL